ncbi:hypothetical protein J6P92_09890 [bacterium]|nr:hypothetical protein [bacterium]
MNNKLQLKINNIMRDGFILNNLMEIIEIYFETEALNCDQILYVQDLFKYIHKKHKKMIKLVDNLILE